MSDALLSQAEIDALLKVRQRSPSPPEPVPVPANAQAVKPGQQTPATKDTPAVAVSQYDFSNLEIILDIPLHVTVRLGQVKKTVREVLKIRQGTIIELDRLAGEPVDIFLNEKLIARGEIVVVGENFGVRIRHIVSLRERVQTLG